MSRLQYALPLAIFAWFRSKEEKICTALEFALTSKNALKTEIALIKMSKNGLKNSYLVQLHNLIEEDWHFSHEDIAGYLQQLKSADSVPILKKTSRRKFDYLEFDNSYALAKKCVWALADIGNEEAFEFLKTLSKDKDKTLSTYAQKRINNWDLEIDRKTYNI